jgi:hypothetical protein
LPDTLVIAFNYRVDRMTAIESGSPVRISRAFRWALATKGALLFTFAGGFALLALGALTGIGGSAWTWLRLPGAALFALLGGFLAWAASLALRDVARGEALRESGAVALASRRSGLSLRLPSGGFAEFILWNPWERLEPGARYRVTYGRFSRVLVEPPEREAPSSPSVTPLP